MFSKLARKRVEWTLAWTKKAGGREKRVDEEKEGL